MFDCHHVWLKWCEGQSLNLFKMNNEKRIPGQLTGRMFDCHQTAAAEDLFEDSNEGELEVPEV